MQTDAGLTARGNTAIPIATIHLITMMKRLSLITTALLAAGCSSGQPVHAAQAPAPQPGDATPTSATQRDPAPTCRAAEAWAGARGPDGPVGAQGARGPAGEVGPAGYAVAGPRGADGPTGPQGPTGVVEHWTSYRDFRFDQDQAVVHPADQAQVAAIAACPKANPSLIVGIDGSTDPRATRWQDLDLNNRRVSAVRSSLLAAGVPASGIGTGAYGDPRLWRDGRVQVFVRREPGREGTLILKPTAGIGNAETAGRDATARLDRLNCVPPVLRTPPARLVARERAPARHRWALSRSGSAGPVTGQRRG